MFAAFVLERLDRGTTAADELRTFLRANVRFMRAHRAHMVALLQVRPHLSEVDAATADDDHRKMADLLREGQRQGEFRDFDADTMAILVLALRNGVLARAADRPEVDLDLDLCERELVTAVELATTWA